ncbi:methionine S-methyltransferase-like, partial [Trifolium medium]|nr:methionine S-methyltransferase-like [Trifolium medium]
MLPPAAVVKQIQVTESKPAMNVVIFPSRNAAIENALRLFSPRLAIVDEHLTRHLPRQWLTSLALE